MGKKKQVMSHDPLSDLDDNGPPAAMQSSEPDSQPTEAGVDAACAESVERELAAADPGEPEQTADKADDTKGTGAVTSDAGVVVALPSSMSVADVGELHGRMLDYLTQQLPMVLDGGDVEVVEGAGIQLLASFVKTVLEKQIPVSWVQSSDVLRAAAKQMGLTTALLLEEQAA